MIVKLLHIIKWMVIGIVVLMVSLLLYYLMVTRISEPQIDKSIIKYDDLIKHNDTTFTYQDAWLRKNRFGLWEMYISGSPAELGVKNGILAQSLIQRQEEALVSQLKKMIPSKSYLNFLKYITSYITKELPDYIPLEYLTEIKAVSLFASPEFNFIGDNYVRQLNYHAAHDIGHAMQNLHLVECTAFGVWNSRTTDSTLLVGRNFDFYVGDEFAKNKIVLFVNPDKGYAFSSITWGGMIGVVSGMNTQGLTVTLNSAKGNIPFSAKTPVSIIAREILQYAKNIEEAYSIACSRNSFVSESFMLSSANDHKVAIIEKTPDTTILYYSDSDHIVLTNHFQSQALKNTPINVENMKENVTTYRFKRVEELLALQQQFEVIDFAKLLRDTKGLKNKDIGLSNEGAVNQLIAHHSIIFKPEQKLFWISSSPFQLGAYPAYYLDSIFLNNGILKSFYDTPLRTISADSSFLKNEYPDYKRFKTIANKLKEGEAVDVEAFIGLNPHYFYTYELIGDYFADQNQLKKSIRYYNEALFCFVPNTHEKERIRGKMMLNNQK